MLVFCKTAIQGAQTTIHCSVAKECEGITGKYWSECAVTKPSKTSLDVEQCQQLFEYSAKTVGLESINY